MGKEIWGNEEREKSERKFEKKKDSTWNIKKTKTKMMLEGKPFKKLT